MRFAKISDELNQFERGTDDSMSRLRKTGCIVTVLLGFCSCGQVDRTNSLEFNEMIIEAIQNQDTTHYSEFVDEWARESFSFERNGWDIGAEAELLEVEMKERYNYGRGESYYVRVFWGGDDLHEASYTIRNDSIGGAFNGWWSGIVNNISDEYRDYKSKPYSGSQDVEFTSLVWRFNPWQKSFETVSVRLKNKSEHDYERIQFKLIIMNNGQQIVRTTVDEPARLFSYDEVDIPVRALSNYFVGEDVNQETISFKAYPLDLSPKPPFKSLVDLERFGYLNPPN